MGLQVRHIIKKVLFCFSTLLCLLLAAGCGKEGEETPTPAVVQYTLTYTAGANGAIDGASPQTVNRGGTASMVRAVPDDGYHFVSWNDGVTTPDRTDANVTANLAVTAEFAINQYTLTYLAGENGSIDGAYVQTVDYGNDGSPVTAVPAEHYHFVSWSDGVATASRTDRRVMEDISITAAFAVDQYTLTYTAEEHGSIDGADTQTVDYGGDGSTVTAIPTDGYHFASWSDGVKTARRTDRKVTEDLEVAATFVINQYTLNYTAGNNGAISGPSPQTVTHGQDGSPVTAAPAEHYHFAGWSDGVTTAERTDRKVTGNIAVTANFAVDQYTLTYTAEKHGAIDGVWSQKVDYGGNGSPVTAIPSDGYHFASWSDGVETARRTDRKVSEDLEVAATFVINQYTLNYTAEEHGAIDGATPQSVTHGGEGSAVTAVADRGYHFVSWNDGITTARRVDAKITGDLTVSAVFAVNTYTIGGNISGLVEGTQVVLENNGGDDLTIVANGDFVFATELLNGATYDVSVLTQPTSPNQTCTVTGGTGTVAEVDVTDIVVTCILNTYTIGGVVSGLPAGHQVVVRNNDADDLVISVNGNFSFATPLDDHSEYEVTVHSQPERPNWFCSVKNAVGALRGTNVTDVLIDCYPEAVLLAKAGIRKVKLNWNSQDFIEVTSNQVTFNLCRAQEKIAPEGFKDCQNLTAGVLETTVTNPHISSPLANDIPYWFQLEVQAADGRRTLSKVVMAIPFGGLNDTGIDWCADNQTNDDRDGTRTEKTEMCQALAAGYPGQDAFYGRDALARARNLDKTGSGSAGFDFTKLCRNGKAAGEGNCPPNPLPGSGTNNWSCTRDNVTGLTWEIKMDGGLHNPNYTYTWYNPDGAMNGGEAGVQNGGQCQGSGCDTQAYIKTINDAVLCGASDWRLPTKRELLSIVDNSSFKPAADVRFFPNASSSYYWSSSPSPEQADSAWQVYFLYGEALLNNKSERNHIRLVRGRAVTFGLDNP
jgi:hypothetical protein